eukprot:tig00000692_g3238.t1
MVLETGVASSRRPPIDLPSFAIVDFLLMEELQRDADGVRKNMFFYKDRGGKLHAGPLWDCGLAFNRSWFCDMFDPEGFAFLATNLDCRPPALWQARPAPPRPGPTRELMAGPLAPERLEATVGRLAAEIAAAVPRHLERWKDNLAIDAAGWAGARPSPPPAGRRPTRGAGKGTWIGCGHGCGTGAWLDANIGSLQASWRAAWAAKYGL